MLTLEITGPSPLDSLQPFIDRNRDYKPVLAEIGEDLMASTKSRFVTSTAPDGTAWQANSAVTMARYSSMFGSSLRKKDGSLNKKGEAKSAGKKPLIGESKSLSTTINYQLQSVDSVSIGSPMIYAATQQFGAKSGEFGFGIYQTRVGSFPLPWGDIPARPYLGASDADKTNIAELLRSYLVG